MPVCEDWVAYHGLSKPLEDPSCHRFGGLDTHPEGIHVGSLEQARMRAGGNPVLKIRVKGSRMGRGPVRVKERVQNWAGITKRHARNGMDALVYLNRWEGLTEDLWNKVDRSLKNKGGWDKFDRMSDAAVKRLVPELQDSWIILDPDMVEIIGVLRPVVAKASPEIQGGEQEWAPPAP